MHSTSVGDSSSESIQSYDESGPYMAQSWPNQGSQQSNWNCSNTVGYQNLEQQACMSYADSCMPSTRDTYEDQYHMPSTREPSLEPVWKNADNNYAWNEEYVADQYAQ